MPCKPNHELRGFAILCIAKSFIDVYYLRSLQKSTDKVHRAVSLQPWHASQPQPWVSATLAAFAAAMKHQMRHIHGELVQIEEATASSQAKKSSGVLQVTLLSLEHQLQVKPFIGNFTLLCWSPDCCMTLIPRLSVL